MIPACKIRYCGQCGAVTRYLTPGGFAVHPAFCRACAATRRKGTNHYKWSGGRGLRNGYVRVYTGPGRERVLEHRLVWEAAHGPIPDGHHVHHINGVKTDNRLENLLVVGNLEHQALHAHERGPVLMGRWSLKFEACVVCGTTERHHEGQGMCYRCRRRHLHPNGVRA